MQLKITPYHKKKIMHYLKRLRTEEKQLRDELMRPGYINHKHEGHFLDTNIFSIETMTSKKLKKRSKKREKHTDDTKLEGDGIVKDSSNSTPAPPEAPKKQGNWE